MRKSAGAVIPMQLNFNQFKDQLTFVTGNEEVIRQMLEVPYLQPFSEQVISFLNDLSKKLMRVGKEYSDVATFGFWCRRSALLKEKEKYDDLNLRLGRGIVFHSTPSNVPVNFAFSFAAGLLAGNANVVRLPAKDFPQVRVICNAVNELLAETHKVMVPYICMVKYPPLTEITDIMSSICATRIIWGGDGTIAEMRKSPLKPRANEITFADRHSIAVVKADEYLKAENKTKIARDFYNDTYFSDQNACTAPRIIFWLGERTKEAKEEFWRNVHNIVRGEYTFTAMQSVGKLQAFYKVAAQKDVKLVPSADQLVMRIEIKKLDDEVMNYKYNSGFFFECDISNLHDILPVSTERCQTLTYYGLTNDELTQFFIQSQPHGIDRAVPMGKSMDFTLVWDGYDLICSLSRRVSVV